MSDYGKKEATDSAGAQSSGSGAAEQAGTSRTDAQDECCGGNGWGPGGHRGHHGRHHGHQFHGRENAWWEDRPLPVKILMGIGFAILGLGLLACFVLVVMALWNWLMPEIFGLKQIDFLQTAGLLLLSTLLFKNFGGGRGGHGDHRRKRELRRHIRAGMGKPERDSQSE